jgi:hypothetical protein
MVSSLALRWARWEGVRVICGREACDEEAEAKPESMERLSLSCLLSGEGDARGDVDWEDVWVRNAESMVTVGSCLLRFRIRACLVEEEMRLEAVLSLFSSWDDERGRVRWLRVGFGYKMKRKV